MTYEVKPKANGREEQIAERINEILANEFRMDPDDYLVRAFGNGKFDLELEADIGDMS